MALDIVDVRYLSPAEMGAYLTVTAAARDKLPSRAAFYKRVRAAVVADRGVEGAERLLVGLE